MVLAAALAWGWMTVMPHPQAGNGGGAPALAWTGVMIVAMMLPLTLASIRHVARSSARPRLLRAIGGFLLGYLAIWMVIMTAITGAWSAIASLAGATVAAVLAMAAAVLWEVAPSKRRMERGCRRTVPLASQGWRADADCARYGVVAAAGCAASCWALMAVCVAFAHSLPVMAVLFGVQLTGRYQRRPSPVLAALVVLAVCVAALVAQAGGGGAHPHHHA